ncbi:MAG: hypothetical protein J6386_23185 [Candidatus Synoicihabitans palmerolidicus]|nr:hypothetical protein [Candidatus Synoicihabitans palmerolidicus]
MSAPSFSRRMMRLGGLWVALAVVTPVISLAQDAPQKELSDSTSEQLSKLRELTDAKKYDESLALINATINQVGPNSYDLTVLSQVKVQILLTQAKYAEAIAPMETALRLGKAYNFIEKRQYLEFSQILSQLYFQEATSTKDLRLKDEFLNKAYQTIKVYLAENDNPTVDSISYAATMIYTQATIDPENTNKTLLIEAKDLAEEGLLLSIKPKETFYVLILAALQQEGKNEESADLLKMLVSINPTSKQYWGQLQATYLNLANSAEPGSRQSLEWNIRTIITIERAQELGFLNTPRDYFNMVGILMNIRRFDQAIVLLEKGLAKGNIDNMPATQIFVAYMGYELKKYDDALPFAEAAKNARADNAERLLEAIPNAVKDRQAALEATI